jgi:hypothetical protein
MRHLATRAAFALIMVLGISSAGAQAFDRVAKIGILSPAAPSHSPPWAAFNTRMSELGWIEGRNLQTLFRSASGDFAQLPAIARDLVGEAVEARALLLQAAGSRLTSG